MKENSISWKIKKKKRKKEKRKTKNEKTRKEKIDYNKKPIEEDLV